MDEVTARTVERVIESMRASLGDPLNVDDMARTAMFSKFHFSRLFQRVTGLPPGRFLSALRLQYAKQLLVTTSLNVGDISHTVGYNSIGTFSSRFSGSVGLSPSQYRRNGGYAPLVALAPHRYPALSGACVQGEIWPPYAERVGTVFVGLFRERIPQGRPVRCQVLAEPGPYCLSHVPEGTWHLMTYSTPPDCDMRARQFGPGGQPLYVAGHYDIRITRHSTVEWADLRLKPMRIVDPPVLMALLDVRAGALGLESA